MQLKIKIRQIYEYIYSLYVITVNIDVKYRVEYLEWSESCGLPGDGEGQGEGGPAHIHQVTEKNTDNLGATCNDSQCSAQKKLSDISYYICT